MLTAESVNSYKWRGTMKGIFPHRWSTVSRLIDRQPFKISIKRDRVTYNRHLLCGLPVLIIAMTREIAKKQQVSHELNDLS